MNHNLNALIAAAVAVAEAMSPEERAAMIEAQRQSWVRGEMGLRETDPPRAPGASARDELAGVESGPGQPIEIVERLEVDAHAWDEAAKAEDEYDHALAPAGMRETAALEREAAAEILRLREQVGALEHEAANMANRRVELEDSVRLAERRAGIEAAAQYHDAQAAEWSEHYTKNGNDPSAREYAKQHSADAAAIRALADKPAPEPKETKSCE